MRLAVESPSFVVRPGGLLSVVTPKDTPDPHVSLGVSYPGGPVCGYPGIASGLCETPAALTSLVDAPLEFTGFDDVEAEPFAVYKGIECWLDGQDDYRSDATAALEGGESHAVEMAFETLHLDGGVGLNGADEVGPVEALAVLEEWAGKNYPGLPIIHVGRYGASALFSKHALVLHPDGSLTTGLGTPVVVGSGYTGIAAGKFPMWVTGQVNLWRGVVTVATGNRLNLNKGTALAERVWASSVDCNAVGRISANGSETVYVKIV